MKSSQNGSFRNRKGGDKPSSPNTFVQVQTPVVRSPTSVAAIVSYQFGEHTSRSGAIQVKTLFFDLVRPLEAGFGILVTQIKALRQLSQIVSIFQGVGMACERRNHLQSAWAGQQVMDYLTHRFTDSSIFVWCGRVPINSSAVDKGIGNLRGYGTGKAAT